MTKSDAFWKSVSELAALSERIPQERREMSGVRHAILRDVLPAALPSPGTRDSKKPPDQ